MQIEEAVKEFLKDIEIRGYTWKTVKGYRTNLNVFLYYCQAEGKTDISNLTMGLVKGFTLYMSEKGSKGTYTNSVLKTIKSFITYCFEEGYGGFNTRHTFSWCKEDKPIIRAFKPQDVKNMLSDCSGRDFVSVRDKALLMTLFETGIRCYELCCIKEDDVHEDFIIINGKNHKQRVVPITPPLSMAFLRYLRMRDKRYPLKKTDAFFVSFHGNQLTNCAVENVVKRHGKMVDGIRVSPHTCRHFFAQQQVKMGTDLYTISRLLGHENIAITQTYLNSLRDEDVIQIAKQKSVLMNMK